MERKVKTAVVGCGMISNIYLKNLKNLFIIIDLVAVCDINPEAAKEKAATYGVERIMTLEEIAADPEIELVVNLTATFAHYDVIRQMLEAGKHVYTEKTFTATLAQAEELTALATKKGLYLGVAPDVVLGAGIQTARRALDSDMIGQVTSGVVAINRNQPLNAELFRFLRKQGGALPYDVGIYYVAVLLALLGPVSSLRAVGRPAPVHAPEFLYANADAESWQIPGNNLVSAILEFECGALISLLFDGNTVNAQQHIFNLYGTRGVLKLGDPNTFDGAVELLYADQPPCTLPFTHGYDGKNTLEPTPFDHYGHRGIGVAEMAYAIRHGRPNRLSKEFGLHCMEIMCGMDEASETGGVVRPKSRFVMTPLKPGYYPSLMGGWGRGDSELSLVD